MPLSPGHVALNVRDLDRSIEFYAEVLGFEPIHVSATADRRYAFLESGAGVDLTLWEQASARSTSDHAGLHHLAFRAADISTIERIEARLRVRGVTIRGDGFLAHRAGAKSGGLFFEDPDGSRLEVFVGAGAEAFAAPDESPACGFF